MAILITVFQCDNCDALIGLKTADDWKRFEAAWWEGFYFQFCPSCTEKPETLERRRKDSKLFTEAEEKIQNVEFIN